MRASFLQLRIYLWIILGVVGLSILSNIIVSISMGGGGNPQVSAANLFTVILIFIGSVLPGSFFKRTINLGATRKEFYNGILVVYMLWSVFLAVLNILWFQLEVNFIRNYEHTFNILDVFQWSQFGIVGMLVYQFGAYMLLLSLLNLLFSGIRHILGIIIWVSLIVLIPIFTSISSLRGMLADGLLALLFNDSLLQGFGLTVVIACLFLAGGWWFTTRRSLV